MILDYYSLIYKGRDIFKDETNGIRKISEHVRYLPNIVLNLKPKPLNRIEVSLLPTSIKSK